MPGTRLSTWKALHINSSALSLKCKMWAQVKCSPVKFPHNYYIKLHNTVYYSVRKRNETLTQAITWRDLENVMLSEVS